MELRMSLIRGPFIATVTRLTERSEPMWEMLRLSEPDKRMKDVEIAIRHMAFQDDRSIYRGNLKTFLDDYCKIMNLHYSEDEVDGKVDQLNSAISCGLTVFGSDTFGRRFNASTEKFEARFNRAIFDVLGGSFQNQEVQNFSRANPEAIVAAFKTCCADKEFTRSVEVTTKTPEAVSLRFEKWYRAVFELTGVTLNLPQIENARN
jgi:hypothetical protein